MREGRLRLLVPGHDSDPPAPGAETSASGSRSEGVRRGAHCGLAADVCREADL